ncbi:hypothetical protein ACIA8K_19355 [Catenuloplanes sp. NPDC051500]|uniref:hypothetical protein n=1 Tax=Catenuloplanes sp. NPDC051500 TaxID=3363959 RepID=UPI0037964659
MMFRGAVALFAVACVIHVGGAALGTDGPVPVAAGAFALALLAGYVITAPSGAPGGVSGRARALLCGGLLAVAVAIVAGWQPQPDSFPAGSAPDRILAAYAERAVPLASSARAVAIALAVAAAAFLLGILTLPRDRRGGFLTAGLAMMLVVGVAVMFSLWVPLPTLPLLFGGPVRFALSLAAGFAIAVFLLLRAAGRRGFPVGVAGVLLAAGLGAVVIHLLGAWESMEDTRAAAEATVARGNAFLQPGLRISSASAVSTAPGWAGPGATFRAALLLAGPLLIVAGALGTFRLPRWPPTALESVPPADS